MNLLNQNSNIMLALDTPDRKTTFEVMDQCHDLIDAVKFNYPLILKEGISIITEVKEKYKLPIVADLKVADVPVTNNRIIDLAREAGADAIMVHGFIGSDAILELKEKSKDEIKIIIVTELTHPGGLEFTRQHSQNFAELCNLLDCFGIQAPGTRPEEVEKLRKIIGNDKIIVSCGVGAQGGKFKQVIDAGANYAIIGRSIYQADNPRKAVLDFINEKETN